MVKAKKSDAFIVAEVWTDLGTYAQYYASGVSCFNFAFGNSDGVIPNTVKHVSGADASSYGRAIMKLQEALAAYDPTPRSSQKSTISSSSARTASLFRFRSGIPLQKGAS